VSYIGALEELQTRYRFASVSTCSAGTLIGALLGAGITPREMGDAVRSESLQRLGRRMRLPAQLWRIRQPPHAFYKAYVVPELFRKIVDARGRRPVRTLGDLDPPLATAAVDLTSRRILVYSSAQHPDMEIEELLRLATAVPLVYPPVQRQSAQLVDAAIAWKVPVWLTAGFDEELDTIVLRPEGKKSTEVSRFLPRWFSWWMGVVSSGIDSRDGVSLDATARLKLYDIPTKVGPFDFHLRADQVEELIESGRNTVAHHEERATDRLQRALDERAGRGVGQRDTLALADAMRRYDKHQQSQVPTVFISYAKEDLEWVERIRDRLRHLVANRHITLWDDSYISTGDDFTAAIVNAVNRAKVLILVGSPAAWASTYIKETELPLLLERKNRGEGRLLWFNIDGDIAAAPAGLSSLDAVGNPAVPLRNDDVATENALSTLKTEVDEALRLAALP